MKIRKQTKKWECKDGRKIRLCDMSCNHLHNLMNWMKRAIAAQKRMDMEFMLMDTPFQGEMATLEFENAQCNLAMHPRKYKFEMQDEVELEIQRRKDAGVWNPDKPRLQF